MGKLHLSAAIVLLGACAAGADERQGANEPGSGLMAPNSLSGETGFAEPAPSSAAFPVSPNSAGAADAPDSPGASDAPDAPGTSGTPDSPNTSGTDNAQAPPDGSGANSTPGSDPTAVGSTPDAGSCTQVDLLFVIDNSPSMGRYQEALAAAFPSFVDAMYERLPSGTSLHLGLTTTSFYTGSCGESVSNCVSQASEAEIKSRYTTPDLGDTGTNGEQGKLYEHQGLRWFDANTGDPDREPVKRWFAEAAVAAGERGCSFEMPSAAAGWALHPANATHNSGFLRDDDTVLVLFVLTDEPDKSPDPFANYVTMVSAAKSGCGGASCVVPAGIVDGCIEGVNNPLWQFLHGFGNPPVIGDIDEEANYADIVGDALAEVIERTCNEVIFY